MNYLERLISRALALPREGPQAVFDPFEQTADWPIAEPPRAAVPEASTRPAASIPRADLPAPTTPDPNHTVAHPVDGPTPPAPATAVAAPPRTAGDPVAPRGMEQPRANPRVVPDRPQRPLSPIEKADAFMRALAVDDPTVRETTRRSERPAEPDPDIPGSAPSAPPPAPPAAHVVRAAPALAPPAPPVRLRTTAEDVPERRRGLPGASERTTLPRDSPVSTRQVASVPPAASARRAAPSRTARRDDLASNVGIVRFGLEQG